MEHYTAIKCPHCDSTKITKNGNERGVQRYRCQNENCKKGFRENYIYNACKVGTKEQVESMTLNGSGVRDISRVLKINTGTITSVLKKKHPLN